MDRVPSDRCVSSLWGSAQLHPHTARHQEAVGEAELPQNPSSALLAPLERRDEGLWKLSCAAPPPTVHSLPGRKSTKNGVSDLKGQAEQPLWLLLSFSPTVT